MDPWRSQIRCTACLAQRQPAWSQVVVRAGAGRLPPSRSAPLSATALENRVRHPVSPWGSARRASSAQTRTRLSRPEPIARAPERWQQQVQVPRPAPGAFAGCPIGCRWSRTMRPSPLLRWNHLAAARRRRTDCRFRCLSQEFIACLALGPVHAKFKTLQLPRETGQLSLQDGTRKRAGWQLPHPHAQACCRRFGRSR